MVLSFFKSSTYFTNRLVKYVDDLKKDRTITEEVIIQTGYSTYEPKYCKWQKLFPYQEMLQLVGKARVRLKIAFR